MASSVQVKDHPSLLAIVGALLAGATSRQLAEQFDLPEAALKRYAAEAGLGREPDPERQPRPPESDVPPTQLSDVIRQLGPAEALDRDAVHEHQALAEASRRRGEPEGQRPEADAHAYYDQSHSALRQELERIEAERQSYEAQPRPHLTLCSDPDFHIGFQPESRLRALITREQLDKAERIRQWYAADVFRWRQTPPDDL